MLVLSRRVSERIFLFLPNGSRIVITVTEVRGRRAQIGIECEQEIKILREEKWEADQHGKVGSF